MGRQSASSSGLYGRQWRKARANYLTSNPLCERCLAEGDARLATEVNHRVRHHGNVELFWDEANWEPICAFHHRSVVARIERSGAQGCDNDGIPISPRHHWNQ